MKQIIIKSYETKKSIITPIVFLIIGLLLFINPGKITEFISYIFGGIFIILGLVKFLSDFKRNDSTTGDNFYSILMMILGIVFIFCSGTIEFVIRLIIGLWICINGMNTIAVGINMVRVNAKSVLTLIIGLLLLIIGVYTILVKNLIFSTIGLILVIYAFLEIVNYFYTKRNNKTFKGGR